ncbi:MAG: PspC domain-containing protein [Lachnospiraceae bacterium]|nr:PspC domain-containing protein [Lachnospiraceae bacterium]
MEQKKLIKSSDNKMICGVCGGIGEYFNLDPTLIRLIWVILTIGGFGTGFLIYILAAVIMPQDY